jgi:cytochrome P450 / NADPH-cytochrome P450 reductase
MLSFALMELMRHPDAYLKVQREVDDVIGSRAIEVSDIPKLSYINAVLRETARLRPTVPVLQKHANMVTARGFATLGGYHVEPSDHIVVLLGKAQQDPLVWGEDASEFVPDRMLDENFDRITQEFPNSWKVSGSTSLGRGLTHCSLLETENEHASVDRSLGKNPFS